MDIRKLQRAIVDGLEDVKAHNIVVFNTEHLSALFERVIVASGASNRQTKALASSVRETVKERGWPVLSVEALTTASGSSSTAALRWPTSCSRQSATTTASRRSGARSR
jgi:ribosomal silencing factor RsfS